MTAPAALIACLDTVFGTQGLPRALGVAVSGGSDSLALLHLLHEWGRVPLVVATVDHGLRRESADEAAQVRAVCTGLGLAHDTLHWRGWDGSGNLQDQARRARYGLLSGWAATRALGDVALGHTLDDQAETFLMGLSRSSGLDGLTGMRPAFLRAGTRFHRPLLTIRRQTLRDYLTGLGVGWADDPTNDDEQFDRIKARRALAALAPLGIEPETLARSIANLQSTRDGIAASLAGWASQNVTQDAGDLLIAIDAFLALPTDFARRMLNAALRWISGADYPPRSAPVMQMLDTQRRHATTLHGCLIDFRPPVIRISREPEAVRRADAVATTEIWDGRWQLNGPHAGDLKIRALGAAGLRECPDWRATGRPRASLVASPAIWRGETLVSAPIAGYANGWMAELCPSRNDFVASLIGR